MLNEGAVQVDDNPNTVNNDCEFNESSEIQDQAVQVVDDLDIIDKSGKSVFSKSTQTSTPTNKKTRSVKTQTFISSNSLFFDSALAQNNNNNQKITTSTSSQTDKKAPECTQKVDNVLEKQTENDKSENDCDKKDKDYVPDKQTETDDSDEEPETVPEHVILSGGKPPQEQVKLIVFEESLIKAFSKCRLCGSLCKLSLENQLGSSCVVTVSCLVDSFHDFKWSTGPTLNKLPAFHLLLASGIVSIGLESSKVLRLFRDLGSKPKAERALKPAKILCHPWCI